MDFFSIVIHFCFFISVRKHRKVVDNKWNFWLSIEKPSCQMNTLVKHWVLFISERYSYCQGISSILFFLSQLAIVHYLIHSQVKKLRRKLPSSMDFESKLISIACPFFYPILFSFSLIDWKYLVRFQIFCGIEQFFCYKWTLIVIETTYSCLWHHLYFKIFFWKIR